MKDIQKRELIAACNLLTKAWGKDSYVTVGRGSRFEVMRTVGAE